MYIHQYETTFIQENNFLYLYRTKLEITRTKLKKKSTSEHFKKNSAHHCCVIGALYSCFIIPTLNNKN